MKLATKRTKLGLISSIYTEQKNSSKVRGHNPPNYSKTDLINWFFDQPNFNSLYDNWVKSDYSKWERPSTDRIDNKLPYTLNNIQLVTFKENNTRSHIDASNGDNISSELVAVDQYTLDSKYIATYKSMSEASKVTGIPIATICNACKYEEIASSTFLWAKSGSPYTPRLRPTARTYIQYGDNQEELFKSNILDEIREYLGKKDLSPLNKSIRKGTKYLGYLWRVYE